MQNISIVVLSLLYENKDEEKPSSTKPGLPSLFLRPETLPPIPCLFSCLIPLPHHLVVLSSGSCRAYTLPTHRIRLRAIATSNSSIPAISATFRLFPPLNAAVTHRLIWAARRTPSSDDVVCNSQPYVICLDWKEQYRYLPLASWWQSSQSLKNVKRCRHLCCSTKPVVFASLVLGFIPTPEWVSSFQSFCRSHCT